MYHDLDDYQQHLENFAEALKTGFLLINRTEPCMLCGNPDVVALMTITETGIHKGYICSICLEKAKKLGA